jgi:peptidoglycan L-alanyl-D-glutamate endopeptidase CwlK
MTSRDPDDLYGPLAERWEYLHAQWLVDYPKLPEPFLTCTFRDAEEQIKLVKEGKSNAQPMQSLHNYTPAYAFDIAFLDRYGAVSWAFHLFEKFGQMAKKIGLVWGGDWPGLVDGPNIQMRMTWRDAQDERVPQLPPLPGEEMEEYEGEAFNIEKIVWHNWSDIDKRWWMEWEGTSKIVRGKFVARIRDGKLDIRED